MSELNRTLIRNWYKAVDAQDLTAMSKLVTAGFTFHMTGLPAPANWEAAKGVFSGFFVGFPDIRHEVLDLIVEGDKAVARLVLHGINTGSFMGMPATGKRVHADAVSWYHLSGGKIAELWVSADTMGLMQQLGAMPKP